MAKYKIKLDPNRIDTRMYLLASMTKASNDPAVLAALMTDFFLSFVYDKKTKEYVEDTKVAGKFVLSQLKKKGVDGMLDDVLKQIHKLVNKRLEE